MEKLLLCGHTYSVSDSVDEKMSDAAVMTLRAVQS